MRHEICIVANRLKLAAGAAGDALDMLKEAG
jgi:hypothetical protein